MFKALLGAERNRVLLTHFLNAILSDALPGPITDTEILNPYNDKEFIDDKLSKRWLKFFNEAEQLDDHALPAWMQTGEMRQAMNTLKAFSEKERAYHAYQARQNFLRVQSGMQHHLEELQARMELECAAKEQERAAKERERAAKERALQTREQERTARLEALAEIERLKRLLGDHAANSPDKP